MADVLVVTWDGGGNVPPALHLAEELRRRHHGVRFLGHAQQRSTFERRGFPFAAYENARPWSSTAPVEGLSGALTVFRMFADRGPGRDLLAQLADHPADVLVLDCMSLGCLDAAERAGFPRAVLAHTFYGFLSTLWAKGPVGAFARLHGLHPVRLWRNAPRLLLATDRQLDPAVNARLPASARYVGVVQPAPATPARSRTAEMPRVLVSLSTLYVAGQEAVLQNVLDALGPLAVHAVVTTGRGVEAARLRVPGNAEVHAFLSHDEVMPTVDLVVCHGGHATTMRALAHDLPVVVLPVHPAVDMRMIGRSVERAGAGRLLAKTATPAQIRAAVEDLLKDGPHREACAQVGARLRAQDGVHAAADAVEELLA